MNLSEIKQQLESNLVFETRTYVYWLRQVNVWNGEVLRGHSLDEQDKIIKTFNQVDKDFQDSKKRLFKLVDDLEVVLKAEQMQEKQA